MKRLIPLAASMVLACALPHPAMAQGQSGDKVNQLIVFGNDPCPTPAFGTLEFGDDAAETADQTRVA